GACSGSFCRIEMFGDVAANATFLHSAVELAVDVSGPGTIVSRPAAISCPGVCSAAFAPDTAVTLIATAAPGASFSGFSDGCGGGACSLNLTAGVHVAASFRTIPSFKVSVTPAGAGIGRVVSTPAGIDCPGACEASFPEGTALTLSATADALSRFAGFEGACAGSQCAGTLRAALPVVARFDQRRYSLVDLGVPGGANWTAAAGISRQGQRVTG